jgi:hypothetical protein
MNILIGIALHIYENHPILFWLWLAMVIAWVVVAVLWVITFIKVMIALHNIRVLSNLK